MNDDFESGDSESTDDTVNTSELPELIEIENPDEPKQQEKEPEETDDDTPTIPGAFNTEYFGIDMILFRMGGHSWYWKITYKTNFGRIWWTSKSNQLN